ncbi:hypothetical protein HGP14_12640 [Rhizobium sp. P32RR-XVIII]|uniref:hypothetical protein n=1 Tax=Rhizobium sp. P32RR-XVIII TaxID=2726738 RepID=UPI001456B29E|nr:hypothetical protein [Rhizobium sp. P32RR-XVIII]NLS04202.1 hypothetical protein [Rhizobium sp. P32RR-XVIII]
MDPDPRVHRKFLEELQKTGVLSAMGDIFEPAVLALPKESLTGVIQRPILKGPAS